MAKYKVDIFRVLNAISNGDQSYFDDLTEIQLKSISPVVLQMWILGANNKLDGRIMMTDAFVNTYAFSLSKKTKLLCKLLCISNDFGTNTRFTFNKIKTSNDNFLVSLTKRYYNLSDEHAIQESRLMTEEDFVSMGIELGFDKDEEKKLNNAIIQRFR